MKLISMKDFVLETNIDDDAIYRCRHYANFLNKPLELGMFVPCDFEGNPLKEPRDLKRYNDMFLRNEHVQSDWMAECLLYEQVKEWVLFEGFELKTDEHGVDYLVGYDRDIMPNNDFLTWNNEGLDEKYLSIIECLVYFNPILTSSAIKQIGL